MTWIDLFSGVLRRPQSIIRGHEQTHVITPLDISKIVYRLGIERYVTETERVDSTPCLATSSTTPVEVQGEEASARIGRRPYGRDRYLQRHNSESLLPTTSQDSALSWPPPATRHTSRRRAVLSVMERISMSPHLLTNLHAFSPSLLPDWTTGTLAGGTCGSQGRCR